MKTALITGITGQDGSYLAELLLEKGYAVHGLVRRASTFNRSRIDSLRMEKPGPAGQLSLHYGELNDPTSLRRLLQAVKPQEIYHLAGQSHVGLSFDIPEVTCHENGMATLSLLEILRDLDYPVRLYHASSSEIFGMPATAPQTEETPFKPVNPYGCAKAFAAQLCRVYRDSYGLFVCSGIAYNHESPRRGENFVTRKITMAAAKIAAGLQSHLSLGNLDSRRDWGYAAEYVQAMWLMLQAKNPADYVLATGQTCTVREFAATAFQTVGVEIVFEGQGPHEVGRRVETGDVVLRVEPRYYRPVESAELVGDATKARNHLGWTPQTTVRQLVGIMARADAALLPQIHRA